MPLPETLSREGRTNLHFTEWLCLHHPGLNIRDVLYDFLREHNKDVTLQANTHKLRCESCGYKPTITLTKQEHELFCTFVAMFELEGIEPFYRYVSVEA